MGVVAPLRLYCQLPRSRLTKKLDNILTSWDLRLGLTIYDSEQLTRTFTVFVLKETSWVERRKHAILPYFVNYKF